MRTIDDSSGRNIRRRAAALLAAAGRDENTAPGARLHCLAALDALAEPGNRFEHSDADGLGAEARVTGALRLLGQLPLREFGRPEVLTAARHARRAIRELR